MSPPAFILALLDMRARRRLGSLPFLTSTPDLFARSNTAEDAGKARRFLRGIREPGETTGSGVTAEDVARYLRDADGPTLLRLDPGFRELTARGGGGRNFDICIRELAQCEIAFRRAWSPKFKADLSAWIPRLSALIVAMAEANPSRADPAADAAPEVQAPDRAPKVRAEVILVHGTWAAPRPSLIPRRKRTSWYDPDHRFTTRLRDHLAGIGAQSRTDAFTWSGKNSVRERAKAAQELADVISERFRRGIPSLSVVAHSHGGHVALRAVDRLVGSERSSPFDPAKLQVITLATPFLQVVDYPIRNPLLSSLVLWLPCSWLLLEAVRQLELWNLLLLLPRLDYGQLRNWVVAGAALAIVTAAMMAVLVTAVKAVHGAYFSAMDPSRVGDIRQVTRALIWQTNYRVPDTLPVRIIRGVSDEASLTLSAGALASRLSLFLNGLVSVWFAHLFVYAVLLGIVLHLLGSTMTLPRFINDDPLGTVWTLFLAIGFPVVLVARIAAMLLKLVYGRELFLSPPRCEIDTSGAPDVNRNATLTTLQPSTRREGLNHSIYDQPLCPEIVADYIAAHAAQAA